MDQLSDNQIYIVSILSRISASIGILGSLSVIFWYIFDRAKQRMHILNRLIFCIAISDLVSGISALISISGPRAGEKSALCSSQAFMQQWGDLSSMLGSGALALNMFWLLSVELTTVELEAKEYVYYMINFIFTFLIACLPLFVRYPYLYGPAGQLSCWITEDWKVFRFLLFYIPLGVVAAFNSFLYSCVLIKLRKPAKVPGPIVMRQLNGETTSSYHITKEQRRIMELNTYREIFGNKILLFAFSFVITYLFGAIYHVWQWISPNTQPFAIVVLMAITNPLRGFFNFIAYFLTATRLALYFEETAKQVPVRSSF